MECLFHLLKGEILIEVSYSSEFHSEYKALVLGLISCYLKGCLQVLIVRKLFKALLTGVYS